MRGRRKLFLKNSTKESQSNCTKGQNPYMTVPVHRNNTAVSLRRGICSPSARVHEANPPGSQTSSTEWLYTWSFYMWPDCHTVQHCTTLAGLWPFNLFHICIHAFYRSSCMVSNVGQSPSRMHEKLTLSINGACGGCSLSSGRPTSPFPMQKEVWQKTSRSLLKALTSTIQFRCRSLSAYSTNGL